MRWILVDVVLALLALGALAVVALGLWRQVKQLGTSVTSLSDSVSGALDALPAPGQASSGFAEATPAGHLAHRPTPPDGVLSQPAS